MTPKDLVNEIGTLVSLPSVCLRVNEMIDDPNSSAADIGKVISQDPGLTTRLLKIANSPFYGLATQIDTVSRAVSVIGTKQMRDLVLATSVNQTFDGIPNDLINMKNFWMHSVYCGIAAKLLAEKIISGGHGESVFVAGLLHDIGQLAMFSRLPDQSREALLLTLEDPEEPEMYIAERKIMGFDHMQVGGEMMRLWNLPKSLQECVEFHHEPECAVEYPREVAIINIANSLACMAELDAEDEADLPAISQVAWDVTGLSKDIIPETVASTKEQFSEVMSMLVIN